MFFHLLSLLPQYFGFMSLATVPCTCLHTGNGGTLAKIRPRLFSQGLVACHNVLNFDGSNEFTTLVKIRLPKCLKFAIVLQATLQQSS